MLSDVDGDVYIAVANKTSWHALGQRLGGMIVSVFRPLSRGRLALSRGAESCTFVDDGRKSLGLLRQNIKITKQSAAATVIARDATRLPANDNDACDLVFLDPPYGKGLGQKALLAARDGGWLAPEALVVFEENAPQDASDGFDLLDQRRYGDTYVSFMEFIG